MFTRAVQEADRTMLCTMYLWLFRQPDKDTDSHLAVGFRTMVVFECLN
jgi:hypothetical protein